MMTQDLYPFENAVLHIIPAPLYLLFIT